MRRSRFKSVFVKTMAGVSIFALTATIGLWVRSYLIAEHLWHYDGQGRGWVIITNAGRIRIEIYHNTWSRWDGYRYQYSHRQRVWDYNDARFSAHSDGRGRYLQFPHWSISALLAMTTFLLMWKPRLRRYPAGHCPNCGYDLRATPDRCPECGLAVDSPTVEST